MRLVHHQQKVLREVVQQRKGRLPGLSAVKVARVVLDARAEPDLSQHFDVVIGALLQPLRLQQLVLVAEHLQLLLQVLLNDVDLPVHRLARDRVMRRRKDQHVLKVRRHHARGRVELADALDLVAEELQPDGLVLLPHREYLQHVAAHAERAARKVDVVAVVLVLHQQPDHLVAVLLHALAQRQRHVLVLRRVAHRVDARHGRDDDHVPPLGQRRRRAVAQPVDLVVDGGVLLDVGVRRGDIRLGLVVVVVGHEVLHRVLGEQLFELRAQLRRQRLVVRQHQRRPLHALDDVGHRKGLARAGHAQQHLRAQPVLDALHELVNGLRLISRGLVLRMNPELRHTGSPFQRPTARPERIVCSLNRTIYYTTTSDIGHSFFDILNPAFV